MSVFVLDDMYGHSASISLWERMQTTVMTMMKRKHCSSVINLRSDKNSADHHGSAVPISWTSQTYNCHLKLKPSR